MIHLFASRYDQWRELLTDAKLRAPDKTFDKDLELDLGGGVTARLLWFGGAHTKGDELRQEQPRRIRRRAAWGCAAERILADRSLCSWPLCSGGPQ